MALPVREQAKYWGIATVVFLGIMWVLGDVILPFVLGAALAYCLDPIADRLEKIGCSRAVATGIITFLLVLVFIIAILLILPTLARQTTGLIQAAPEIASNLQVFLTERFPELGDANSTIRRSLATVGETIQTKGGELFNTILASFSGVVNAIVLFVIVPVVAFYLLYVLGTVVLVVLPASRAGSARQLLLYAALFGLCTFGAYDLTNWATLRDWPGIVVLVDMIWGLTVTVIISLAGYYFLARG